MSFISYTIKFICYIYKWFVFYYIENITEYHIDRPYCFRFTWLGPKYDENSNFKNASCSDIIGDKGRVPCVQPLIATGT